MKMKSMALLLIAVGGLMLLLSPFGSISTSLAQQERLREQREQEVDSAKGRLQRPVDGGPCGIAQVDETRKHEIEGVLEAFKQESEWSFSAAGSIEIKVYFHVIRDNNGNGDVSDATLDQQITILNNSFNGTAGGANPGANTPFRFVKVCVNRVNNSTWYNMSSPGSAAETAAKTALHLGGATDLNFYTINDASSAWARFPWEYDADPALDGIVVPRTLMPGGGRPNFDLGDIAVHEVGHWLGLWHTFQGGCSATNDQVADTPAHTDVVATCQAGLDTCPTRAGLDPIDNFMSNASDACKMRFTPGQSSRMDSMYGQYRQPNSCNACATQCGSGAPTASISWIAPSESTWGPPNTMTVAGYAQNGCTNVKLFWRDTTAGGNWNAVSFQAIPNPSDGSWSNSIPSPYKCHDFEAYVVYSCFRSPIFRYDGRNSGYCNE
ncbi:MAG TPA: zinc metalloprotease, partial [Blastocatellia bacterium]|nr:zinc metalloprotease [Blastocatellia bacterium]